MRVALIDPSLFTLPYDTALAGGLRAGAHDVTLYGRKPRPSEPDAATKVEAIFYRVSEPLTWFPRGLYLLAKGADHLASMLRLQRRLRAERPDVIHFQWLPVPALDRHLLAGFRRIAPVVLTVHDTDPFNGSPSAALQRHGFAKLLAACDGLIVHTQQGLSRLMALGVPAGKLSRLPHGRLVPARLANAPDAMQGELTFVLFGKIKPYKGADLLIAAFAALPEAERRQSRVRIVGQSYMDVDALRAQAAALGVGDRIAIEARFVPDDEVGQIFGAGTVAAFPYREIEASGVLSLALAHGRPILAAQIGNFAESIEHDVHGLLFPMGDVSALAGAMRRLIADRALAARLAGNVIALEAAQPDWDEIANMTVRSYEKAARVRAPATVRAQAAEAI